MGSHHSKMEGEVQVLSKHSGHTCGVCGDSASCYRLYGATTVCYSCRIFFRRTVKTKHNLTCAVGGEELCTFDKTTRNKCRKCRYGKCLQIGMNPLSIDSCKKVAGNEAVAINAEKQLQEQPSQRTSVIVRNQHMSKYPQKSLSESVQFSGLSQSLNWCTKDYLE